MPAKPTTDFSLTIRFGVPVQPMVPIGKLQELLMTFCSKYVIAYEQKGDESTGHWQCALVTKEVKRQDKLKATIVGQLQKLSDRPWSDDNKKHAVDVKAHHQIVGLAGGYCMKQVTHIEPVIYGFTQEELEEGSAIYQQALTNSQKKYPVSKSARTELLKTYSAKVWQEIAGDSQRIFEWDRKNPAQKVDLFVSLIIADGYDLSECWGPLVRTHYIKYFSEIFEEKSPEKILQEFFSSPGI